MARTKKVLIFLRAAIGHTPYALRFLDAVGGLRSSGACSVRKDFR